MMMNSLARGHHTSAPAPRRIASRILRRPKRQELQKIRCDVCVVGSGAAGISAALESVRLGNKVLLVEASPSLGGQSVHSIVGTFCGFYSNGADPYQLVYGIASEIITELGSRGAIKTRKGRNTIIHVYDEVALSRWVEQSVAATGITPLLGATIREVSLKARKLGSIVAATRFGDVEIEADHYIDASGDAVLSWLAGLQVQEAEIPIRGTQMMTLDGVDTPSLLQTSRDEVNRRAQLLSNEYGISRRDGFTFSAPASGVALVNMTHLATPMDAVKMSRAVLEGREQADRVLKFLQTEFPAAFGAARVRSYGTVGVRQTRMIKGTRTLTADQVRQGARFDDAVARCSWPIELHDNDEEGYWEEFSSDHMHYVPLGSLLPQECDNLVTAGRCIDADPVALSSVRVIGPCIAMGAAAAHACDLAGAKPIREINFESLRHRIRDNLERADVWAGSVAP
ncbi:MULTISPECIES: FAD-dependent oxidoreductase [unclassified Beijerinckia]|uniref:FAD-dependent oxidoreductase n=1 Tax=unclassified Beijerinckia TaxID=2638183 RepID=UPI00089D2872|nr:MULTISPECIES: FAD-dependent oxidoreductase [unclassified Beijerinckia]MDH7799142.1 hypothetical protein [Beijerinckia sp. GAS462]SED93758.1 FAD dependent oxidoreductase [Beijerinckia sp. 28-YEA-48]